MSVSSDGKRVSKPVSIGDLRTVLSNSSYSLGDLCTANTIAKWAKYKPIRHSSNEELTEAQRKAVNCGMVAPNIVNSAATAVNNPEDAAAMVWVYNKPRGYNGGGAGVHEWYRQLDFDGYNKEAVNPPIRALSSTYYKVWGGGVGLFSNTSVTNSIQYSDINANIVRGGNKSALPLGDWYMAVIVKVGTTQYIKTTANTLSVAPMVNLTPIDIQTIDPQNAVNSFTFYIVLCDTKQETLVRYEFNPNRVFYPALCDSVQQVNGTIVINHDSGMSMSVESLNTTNSIPARWPEKSIIQPFIGPPISGSNSYAGIGLGTNPKYSLALIIRINNNSAITRNISVSGIKCKLSSNFYKDAKGNDVQPEVGTNDPNNPLRLYNSSGGALGGSISVPANNHVDIIALLPDHFYRMDNSLLPQNVTAGQKIWPTLSFTNNGTPFVSVVIKVQN